MTFLPDELPQSMLYYCAQLRPYLAHPGEGTLMRLRFLGSTSEAGACPSLYETDRGTIVVQGLTLTDPDAHADLRHVLDGESAVEVPRELLIDIARRVLSDLELGECVADHE
jgi:hypothetical protein